MNAGHDAGASPSDELDALLSRAVRGDAAALSAVRARGAADPSVLDELALWQADELRLSRATLAVAACADRVDLPARPLLFAARPRLGWAVAALLALGWLGSAAFPRAAEPVANVAGLGAPAFASSDAAFDAYVAKAREEGVVYGEVAPPVLVGTRELSREEGFEIIVVRQVYERRRAPELYGFAPSGETGRARTVVIRPRTESVQ